MPLPEGRNSVVNGPSDAPAVYRYEVPVDDSWHRLELSGEVLHVAARSVDVVEVWAKHTGGTKLNRYFTVVGTGHPWPHRGDPRHVKHVGTALIPGGALVWHLLEAPW